MALQYTLFALSCVLLMVSGGNICKGAHGNLIIPVLVVYWCIKTGDVNPGVVLTETYTIFLLSLSLWIFYRKDIDNKTKAIEVFACFMIMVFIRPAVSILIIIPIVFFVFLIVDKKMDKKTLKNLFCLLVLFIFTLGINIKTNKEETGYFVPLQNYGEIPLYQANNINTKSYQYNSGLMKEFSDEFFFEVYFNDSLDSHQKSSVLEAKAKKFVLENPLFSMKKAEERYFRFISNWKVELFYAFLSLIFLLCFKNISKYEALYLLGAFLLLTIPPSFGLYRQILYLSHCDYECFVRELYTDIYFNGHRTYSI